MRKLEVYGAFASTGLSLLGRLNALLATDERLIENLREKTRKYRFLSYRKRLQRPMM